MTAHSTREIASSKLTGKAQLGDNSTKTTKIRARIPFTEKEDENLKNLVAYFGEGCWRNISLNMPGRTAKQCKERYLNSLAPNIKNGEWTTEEEDTLSELVRIHGKQWSIIAKCFNGRGPNNIKNHWNRVMTKKMKIDEPIQEVQIGPFDDIEPYNVYEEWSFVDIF